MPTFTLHTLGCGSAKPSLRHNPSCTVLNIRERLFMIDCGEGAQLAMQKHRLKFNRLEHIFLTHLHGDHCLGLQGLLATMGLMQTGGCVNVYTFQNGIDMFSRELEFYSPQLPFEVRFHPIKATEAVVYEDSAISVRTIPLRHRVPTVGYVFEEKPKLRHIDRAACDWHRVPVAAMRAIKEGQPFVKPDGTVIPAEALTKPASPSVSYAHIGDTAYWKGLAPKIGAVDLLYHETTYLREHEADAKQRGHSTAAQAAQTALDCGAKALLTGHYSSRVKDDNLFAEEAKTIFPNTILNREGLVLPLD